MKTSVVTSAVLHGLVLAAALVTIGSPESFKVDDFEAMPVDLVPVESITQMQQGDKTAKPNDKPAPKPTSKPADVADAENLGDNKIDLKTPPIPNAKPNINESTAAPKAVEKPLPQNDPVPNEVKEIMKEDTVVDEPKEVASIPETKPEVAPTPPKPEEMPAEPAEPPKPEAEALPDNVPTPVAKPQVKPPEQKPAEKPPEKAQDQQKTADKQPDKKKADKAQEKAKASSSKQSDFNADDIAVLLNKQDPSNGGAKRSTEVASLGAKKSNNTGSKLSMSEMDALRNAIAGNWQIIPGLADMDQVRITVHMKLDENGEIIGDPEVEATGGNESTRRALAGGAYRAVKRSAPFTNLPKDKYDAWSEVIVNFDPSQMAL
jgi:NACalpha-BTF3-like transcription factor